MIFPDLPCRGLSPILVCTMNRVRSRIESFRVVDKVNHRKQPGSYVAYVEDPDLHLGRRDIACQLLLADLLPGTLTVTIDEQLQYLLTPGDHK